MLLVSLICPGENENQYDEGGNASPCEVCVVDSIDAGSKNLSSSRSYDGYSNSSNHWIRCINTQNGPFDDIDNHADYYATNNERKKLYCPQFFTGNIYRWLK